MGNFFLGFAAATAIAVPAWRFKALDLSGAIAAVFVGAIIFGMGGWMPSVALIAFFLTGSILSKLPRKRALDVSADEPRGRSWRQVAANGLFPALVVVGARLFPGYHSLFLHAFFGSVAAACSDSWATELGTRFGRHSRNILTGKPEVSGVSGGVSSVGFLASICGAMVIAVTSLLESRAEASVFAAIAIAGFMGAVSDSILGASFQARFRCGECGAIVEVPEHCSRPTILISGYKNVKNNTVNFVASAIGAILAMMILDLR